MPAWKLALILQGEANDYVGKGMAGGRIVLRPPTNSVFESQETPILGNTCLYGATGGELYQWKDANGVTHYSDAPPPGQTSYENRSIRNSGGTADAPEKAEAPAES